ncbi:TPA: hypothetical protein ACK3Q6_006450 [Burkholderia cepacia]|uniref:Uncharacterized protein n=3 Tax=Burkholderia cepacia complex TaxID=87882 RepID=A0A250LNR1_9BURK|nr:MULTISPECIES: hypothetical protein [Burkholderia]KKL36536.1 hypothetical protein WR31_25530 [Burkholderia contaminans LMG 23361]MBA9831143.1 hypothetical protein [Burkholderia contaminans]MBA9839201.1 hypothetical protein [Burkholderia contaminans]MBA9864511.1 hypothetical protein [Burkholderia contaminans]MBA9906783.1 hypothetical protein [Burkholderia contaminans]
MTPEQIALQAIRERNSQLEALCARAGAALYQGQASRPEEGYKCAISRQARVFRLDDGKIIVEGVQIWHKRFQTSNRMYFEVDDETAAKGVANEFLARPFL